MSPSQKGPTSSNRVVELIRDFFGFRLLVQQKFGKSSFAIPVWLVLLLVIPFHQLVLIALLLALLTGYRLSLDSGR